MADYRRLISYIYEYEGKQKGKNVGFAKLEARNGQCRINVNVKRIYMSGNAIGAYLLGTGGRETFLGNVFVRGGNGEFRANVDTKNVEGTGTGLDTYFGLSVHDVFHTQIGVGNRLDGGRRRIKKYLWSFLRTAPVGQVRL